GGFRGPGARVCGPAASQPSHPRHRGGRATASGDRSGRGGQCDGGVGGGKPVSRVGPHATCRGKVESSAFRIVSDLVILYLLAAIPSTGIVLHRAHPSRLPFGAQPRSGPDG